MYRMISRSDTIHVFHPFNYARFMYNICISAVNYIQQLLPEKYLAT